jgi:hypothetical protein
MLFIAGVTLNRINTYVTAVMPPNTDLYYLPSVGELAICLAQIATLLLIFRIIVFVFPVISQPPASDEPAAQPGAKAA